MDNPYKSMNKHIGEKLLYEDFCKMIDEPIMKDRLHKSRQLKKMRNFMDINNTSGRIIINHIYEGRQLLLQEKKAKFTEYIEDVIISYLATNEERHPTMTYKDLAEYLCLVNEDYYVTKYDRLNFIDGISKKVNAIVADDDFEDRKFKDIGVFYSITDKLIKEIIKNALKSLKQRSLILYHDTFKLYEHIYIPKTNSYITKTHILNQTERELFLNLRKSVMKRHGLDKMQDVIYLSKENRQLYFDDLSDTLSKCDELYNATRYANAFQIEYGENAVLYEYKRLQETNKNLLNYNMQYKLLTTEDLNLISSTLKEVFIDSLISKK